MDQNRIWSAAMITISDAVHSVCPENGYLADDGDGAFSAGETVSDGFSIESFSWDSHNPNFSYFHGDTIVKIWWHQSATRITRIDISGPSVKPHEVVFKCLQIINSGGHFALAA